MAYAFSMINKPLLLFVGTVWWYGGTSLLDSTDTTGYFCAMEGQNGFPSLVCKVLSHVLDKNIKHSDNLLN